MTIKTWQERLEESAHRLPSGALHTSVEEIEDAMQAEIDELRAGLEAWEKQEPVGWKHKDNHVQMNSEHLSKRHADEYSVHKDWTCLIEKPKEQHD